VSRRAVVTLALVVMVASVALLFVQGARAWGFTADRLRRAEEIMARESSLYRQLANQDEILESQRRIYMERFRRLEAQLQQRDEDVAVLRERLVTMQRQSRSPFTGGQQR
jgi:biopolymer transport protein ExbB/TolQ